MKIDVYHGDNFGTLEIDPQYMFLPNANCQEGPGIYFSDKLKTAQTYGSHIIKATIDLDRFLPSREFAADILDTEDIAKVLLRMDRILKPCSDDMFYFASNYVYMTEATPLDFSTAYELASFIIEQEVRGLLIDLARIDAEAFIEAWNEIMDYDGTYNDNINLGLDEIFVAVVNPEIQVTVLSQ